MVAPSWLIVFCDVTPDSPWIPRHMPRGFQHVLALTYQRGIWVLVDPCDEQTVVRPIDGAEAGLHLARGVRGGGVLRMREREDRRWWWPSSPCCVGVLCRVLGCRALVATPRQFYGWLLRHGAVHERVDDDGR